jgi:hypothetical protein
VEPFSSYWFEPLVFKFRGDLGFQDLLVLQRRTAKERADRIALVSDNATSTPPVLPAEPPQPGPPPEPQHPQPPQSHASQPPQSHASQPPQSHARRTPMQWIRQHSPGYRYRRGLEGMIRSSQAAVEDMGRSLEVASEELGRSLEVASGDWGRSWQVASEELGRSWQVAAEELGRSWQVTTKELDRSWQVAAVSLGNLGRQVARLENAMDRLERRGSPPTGVAHVEAGAPGTAGHGRVSPIVVSEAQDESLHGGSTSMTRPAKSR